VQASEQAIANAGDDEIAMVNKIFPRMMNSLMNLLDWESARNCWIKYNEVLIPALSSQFNLKTLQQAENCWKIWDDEKAVKRKVFGTLPRYRQRM